jgi:hypothetical protein
MPGAIVFSDPRIGVRFAIDDRFVPGPAMDPSPELEQYQVRSAYLACRDTEGRQYVLSMSSVAVEQAPTREELQDRLPAQNEYNAGLAAGRGWLLNTPAEIVTVDGRPVTRNEFVRAGTHPDDRATEDADEDASGHVQACTVFLEGRTISLMLGVHPPGDLDEAGEASHLSTRAHCRRCGRAPYLVWKRATGQAAQ